MEHAIPPISILFGANLFFVFANLTLLIIFLILPEGILKTNSALHWTWINILYSVSLLLGQAIYIFSGLLLVKTPAQIYLRLLYIPAYLIWKIWQYVQVLFGREQNEWVRTTRNEG
jgi:hypothetical protein